MLRKKEVYTTVTPIPGFIPRQLAIDILHSHSEVITLNPLVLDHKPIKAPRDAASDEYYSTWYEISQRIQYIPGIGKMGSGKIAFNGCFHDMPWGLQTHTYAPMNIDIRIKYRIDGNQPGFEPPQPPEIGTAGLGIPADGLYLREDIEIRCNVTMVGFVKAQLKAASKEMVSRIIKKAELLDAGVLQAMIENGKLRTINPADRTTTMLSDMRSPTLTASSSPRPDLAYQIPRPLSAHNASLGGPRNHRYSHQYSQSADMRAPQQHQDEPQTSFIAELPGNFYHPNPPAPPPPQPSPGLYPDRDSMSQPSQQSPDPNSWRWSQGQPSPSQLSSRPTSMASSEASSGFASPALDHKGFSSELPTHPETQEEHRSSGCGGGGGGGVIGGSKAAEAASLHMVKGPQAYQAYQPYNYNPQDYAPVGR
ncbi:hypothetical protein LX36DRAFT_661202 [Colletotrichum falcatum]|nr:hypothetical protein LX36DRAFT_661202 [Colletotrichum falcatum]